MPTKDETKVRINGGEHIWYKLPSGSWTDFGIVKYGYELDDGPEIAEISVAGGRTISIEKQGTKKILFEMAQTSKSELELRDSLNGKSAEIYIYDGIVGTKHIEFYAKGAIIWINIKKKEGDEPQVISIILSLQIQSALCSVADTGLPSIKKAATGTYTGTNYYYLWIETTVA